jgi:hypothetical protein
MTFFFFQKKKQKALFCFAEGMGIQTSAKPTQGVWGRAPRKPPHPQQPAMAARRGALFLSRKEACPGPGVYELIHFRKVV